MNHPVAMITGINEPIVAMMLKCFKIIFVILAALLV